MTTNQTSTTPNSRQFVERTDRRQVAVGFLSKHRLNGRRKNFRRKDESNSATHYVDRYSRQTSFASMIILLLCIVDAFMTLNLLNHGATEANLVMRLAIEEGVAAFILTKYLMTAASVLFLVVHSNFRIARSWQVHHLISGFALIYVVLLIYEVALLRSIS